MKNEFRKKQRGKYGKIKTDKHNTNLTSKKEGTMK